MSASTLTNSGSNTNTSALSDSSAKRYSLVKWLENSQFDAQNEWLGRLTSMPHSSIIDFDADELKAGMEISVIRNNGEIWRAQVIIPKTASNTIDLPPSSVKKIRTKAMGSTGKTVASNDHDTSSSSIDQSSLIDLNDFSNNELSGASSVPVLSSINTSNTNSLIILTANNAASSNTNASSPSMSSKNKSNNKEWQFLQTAITDTSLGDFYQSPEQPQQQATSTVIKLNNLTPITLTPTAANNTQQIVTVSDMNIETILQMQCELLEQQKELKSIELETMEQLRLLQQNISKLARKFDSFETTCSTYFSTPNGGADNGLKSAKNVFNKFNSSIKLVESELLKEFQQQPIVTTTTVNLPINNTLGPSTSTLSSSSSSSSSSPTTTTVTLTNHGDLNHQLEANNLKPTTTIVNLLPSSSSQATNSPTTRNNKQKNDVETNDENVGMQANNTASSKATRSQGIQTQMALNRFLRESVKQKLGAEFLIAHAVSDIPGAIMRQIKKEAFEKYLPNDQRPIKAWGLAMASLRCLKRDLVKNKNKQLAAAAAAAAATSTTIASTTAITVDDKLESQTEMDCDEKAIDSDNNTAISKTTTRRSGINLTVASSLSYIPTRSSNVAGNTVTSTTTTRRQLNTANSTAATK